MHVKHLEIASSWFRWNYQKHMSDMWWFLEKQRPNFARWVKNCVTNLALYWWFRTNWNGKPRPGHVSVFFFWQVSDSHQLSYWLTPRTSDLTEQKRKETKEPPPLMAHTSIQLQVSLCFSEGKIMTMRQLALGASGIGALLCVQNLRLPLR